MSEAKLKRIHSLLEQMDRCIKEARAILKGEKND